MGEKNNCTGRNKDVKKKAIAPVQNKLEPKLLCRVQRRIQGLIFGGAQNRT